MFNHKVRLQFPDILFFLVYPFLIGRLVLVFWRIDEIFGLSLLIPAFIILLAYIWKFCLNYKKVDEEVGSPKIDQGKTIKIPVKKYFEA